MKTRRTRARKQTAQDKAAMAALRSKGINPTRSAGARKAWLTRYAKLPDVPRSELRRIEAMRGPRAMAADARRTGEVVLKPNDRRVFYWTRRPGGYDVEGIDTEGAKQPKPIEATRDASFVRFKRAAERRRRLREQGRPARPAGAKPAPTAPEGGVEAPKLDALKEAAARILGKPTMAKVPPATAKEEKVAEAGLKHLLFGDRPRALKAATRNASKALKGLDYDLAGGGILVDDENQMAVFNRRAKPPSDQERERLGKEGVPIVASLPRDLTRQRHVLDLDEYLRSVHGNPDVVPIGGSLFERKRIAQVARAFGGPVEVEVGNDMPITISKGDLSVMLAPRIPDEDEGGPWGAFAAGLPSTRLAKAKPAAESPLAPKMARPAAGKPGRPAAPAAKPKPAEPEKKAAPAKAPPKKP